MPSGSEHPIWSTHFLGNIRGIYIPLGFWPYLKVKQSLYRFRIVNTSDTRVYELVLRYKTEGNLSSPALDNFLPEMSQECIPKMIQIGTDGGYLHHYY